MELTVVLYSQMQTQVSQLNNKVRDTRVMTSIKTMQAKHLIDEKSELQSLLQDRDQQLRIIQEGHQVCLFLLFKSICSASSGQM